MKASQIVEAILFSSDAPLKAEEIARADESLNEDNVEEALRELRTFYDETERSYQIEEVAEGFQILTRPEFATYLERFDTVPRPSRLSGPALETLAIIAYRQPIGRVEIEYVRGVSSSGVIRSLQDRALVDVVGRAEGLGRPLLYGTTNRFLEHFGFSSLNDLPRPEELPVVLRERIPILEEDDEETGDPDQLSLEGEGTTAAGEESVEEASDARSGDADSEADSSDAETDAESDEGSDAGSESGADDDSEEHVEVDSEPASDGDDADESADGAEDGAEDDTDDDVDEDLDGETEDEDARSPT